MSSYLHPSPLKRLLADLYDSLLVLATLFFATAITLPFTKGVIAADKNIYMSLYLLTVIYLFYGWFWSHGGQTLGMRAWQQKLVSFDGHAVSWKQSFIRFITALPAWGLFFIGLLLWSFPDKIKIAATLTSIPNGTFVLVGFIWILLDTRSNNWRDKLSGTHIILVETESSAAK